MSPKKELILFVREHSLVNNSGKVGIADEGPMVGYSDCPRKKNYYYSSGSNHLLKRAVGCIADEGPMAGYSDCPRKKNFIFFVREQSLVSESGRRA